MVRDGTLMRRTQPSSRTCRRSATTRFTATSSVRAICQRSQTSEFRPPPGRARIWLSVNPPKTRSLYDSPPPTSAEWKRPCCTRKRPWMSMAILQRLESPRSWPVLREWSSRPDADRQTGEAAERIVEAALGPAAELDRFHLARQERQHDLSLEARDRHPDAAVDAHAEGQVPGRAPRDVEAVRTLPAPGVAVGGGEEKENLLPLAEL